MSGNNELLLGHALIHKRLPLLIKEMKNNSPVIALSFTS